MGENTKISWCHHTFQGWIGCTKVSDGCKNCYAEVYDRRVRGINGKKPRRWGPSADRERTSEANWKKPLKWNEAARVAGERHRVFCASLADVFDDHPSIRAKWREDLWTLIARTPHLDWLLLTKRPENIAKMLDGDLRNWPNIWIGTTVENQEAAEKRIPELLRIKNAAVRFLSCEPLLEEVDLRKWLQLSLFEETRREILAKTDGGEGALPKHLQWNGVLPPTLSWVIIGGESGPAARPFDLGWARLIQQQCALAKVACFVKQLGGVPMVTETAWREGTERGRLLSANNRNKVPDGYVPIKLHDSKGGDIAEFPVDLRVREFPEAR